MSAASDRRTSDLALLNVAGDRGTSELALMNTASGWRSPWVIGAVFVALFILFQGAWIAARGSAFEHWLIEDINVR